MKPGRNDPCPCGSGKKYKHCCLKAGAADGSSVQPVDLVWRKIRKLLDGHVEKMLRFVHESYGIEAVHEAWPDFIGKEGIAIDFEAPLMQLYMPWFFTYWMPEPAHTRVADEALHGVQPLKAYLSTKGRHLDPLLRRYLESLLRAPFTFFEVLASYPGLSMTLSDVMTHEEYVVTERSLTKGVQRGDLLFGQLASVDQLHMLEASNAFAIPPMEKAQVIALRAHIQRAHPQITTAILWEYRFELIYLFHDIAERLFNPPMPTLQNTDGEALTPHKLVFDLVATPQAAFDALKHLGLDETEEEQLADAIYDSQGALTQVRFTWMKRGNKMHAEWDNTTMATLTIDGKRLTAEVNSAARATAVRQVIETSLVDGVRYRASEIQSMEKILADAKAHGSAGASTARAESERLAALPEVRAKLNEMLATHWERWVDQPLPMLGNRTPMQAIRDTDGREIVESIILQAERHALTNVPTDPAVFQRLRKRLGLAEN